MSSRLVLALLTLCCPLAAQDIAGQVVEDTTGNPVASAELKLRKDGQRELAAELETDRSGRFHAEGVAAGDYTLEIGKANFVNATLRIHLPDSGLAVRLVKFGVIAGHARDANGMPLPSRVMEPGGRTRGGARIGVLAKIPGSEGFRLVRTLPLGDGGAFRIYDLPPGQYEIGLWYSALAAGSGATLYPDTAQPRLFTVTGAEDYRNIDFSVPIQASFSVSGTVSGTVAGSTPNRPPSFVVSLGLPQTPWLPVAQQWTEANGAFHFDNVPPGTYELFASGPTRGYGAYESILGDNRVFGRTRVSVSGQNVDGIQVATAKGVSLSVTAKTKGPEKESGACPQSVPFALRLAEPWSLLMDESREAPIGKEISISDLAPGRYQIGGRDMGGLCFAVNDREIDVRSQEGPAVIEVAPAGRLRGLLRGDVKAGQYAIALLTVSASAEEPARFARNDAQGRFNFDSLPPGKYRLAIQPAAARWSPDLSKMIEVDIAGGTPTDMELPAPAIAQ